MIYSEEMTADSSTILQIIAESNQDYNQLCVKMARLEHHAIMNDDKYLLSEGIKDFGRTLIEKIKVLIDKFIEFCNKVYDFMQELMIKVARALAIANKINGVGRKVRMDTDEGIKDYLKIKKFIIDGGNADIDDMISDTTSLVKVERFFNMLDVYEKNGLEFEASKQYDYAIEFTDSYTKMARYIKTLRKEAKARAKEIEREAREEEEGYGRDTQFERLQMRQNDTYVILERIVLVCTKALSYLRRGLAQSFKVIYACGKVTSNVTGKYNKKTAEKKNEKKINDYYERFEDEYGPEAMKEMTSSFSVPKLWTF